MPGHCFYTRVLAVKGCRLETECPLVNTEDLVSVLQQKAETTLNATLWSTRDMCHMAQRFSLRALEQTLEKKTSQDLKMSVGSIVVGTAHPELSSMTCSCGWLF